LKAFIQVWAKGFDDGKRSGEFDLVVPKSKSELGGIESRLAVFDGWGALIEPLYKLGHSTTARQFVTRFAPSEFLVACVSASSDRHGRPSVVLVAASLSGFDWRDAELGGWFSRAHALSSRLSERYAKTMAGAPDEVADQLRSNRFLPDRGFSLELEPVARHVDWEVVTDEVRRWKGVTGIATPALAGLGANVLYGTRDEIDRARTEAIDGRFDVARTRIEPIGKELQLWESPVPVKEEKIDASSDPGCEPTTNDPLHELNQNVVTLIDVVVGFRDTLFDLLRPGESQQRGKRKKKR
jgi:hypothetical protein